MADWIPRQTLRPAIVIRIRYWNLPNPISFSTSLYLWLIWDLWILVREGVDIHIVRLKGVIALITFILFDFEIMHDFSIKN